MPEFNLFYFVCIVATYLAIGGVVFYFFGIDKHEDRELKGAYAIASLLGGLFLFVQTMRVLEFGFSLISDTTTFRGLYNVATWVFVFYILKRYGSRAK